MITRVLIAGLALFCAAAAWAEEDAVAVTGRGAFMQPLPGLAKADLTRFREGEGVFRQAWLVAPSTENTRFDGLGPLSNRRSCVACHIANGRGETPKGPNDVMRSMLVRLSVPGITKEGAPKPEPTYGDQLQPDGNAGIKGEGEATFRWIPQPVRLGDGTTVTLRKPELVISKLAYGPLAKGAMTSVRLPPPIFGLGLLEAVPNATLGAMADPEDRDHDGIRGRVNHVWSQVAEHSTVGRFGLKANQPSLRQQVGSALHGDMGITSLWFPDQNCTAVERDCLAADRGPQPEIAGEDFSTLVSFIAGLAPPARRVGDETTAVGENTFTALGCAACHRPTLVLDSDGDTSRTIHPYSDLLIHDMGPGLADGRPDYEAGPRDWRTAPLWGIGLTADVTDHPTYLHDGRARDLTEAILWHGGEADPSKTKFKALPLSQRQALIAFLNTL